MEKSFFSFSKIIIILIAGMLLCVFLATFDNFSPEGNLLNIISKFILLYFYMFLLFLSGICITAYKNLGYAIHNIIFYLFLIALIINVILFLFKKKLSHKNKNS